MYKKIKQTIKEYWQDILPNDINLLITNLLSHEIQI